MISVVAFVPLCAQECTMLAASGVQCVQKELCLPMGTAGTCTCTEFLCSSRISGNYFPVQVVLYLSVIVTIKLWGLFLLVLSGRFFFLSFVLSSVRTWLWSLFAVEDRIIQLNSSLGWKCSLEITSVQLLGHSQRCQAVNSLWLQLQEDYMSSAGFLLSNLRVEILDPPCNKDPFLFELDLSLSGIRCITRVEHAHGGRRAVCG